MSLEIIRNDITKVKAEVIVNAASPLVSIGYGVDAAIYEAAGKEKLFAERKKIGVLNPGEIGVTPGFKLHAKYIIHAIGPVWKGGNSGEVETLAKCYKKSLEKAKQLDCKSIAFPLMASGTYGFPKAIALKTAISEISGFLSSHEMLVYLVVYDKESFEVSSKIFNDIKEYISENEIRKPKASSIYGNRKLNRLEQFETFSILPEETIETVPMGNDIDTMIRHKEETFQEYLFRLIDRKGFEDTEVYKKANIDRKHFSKIRSNVNYNPSKRTAVAFAIALGLNLDETKDLLLRAGIALSHSNIFDIIIEYCITHHITDIHEINCILFKYDQPTLGA